MSHTIELWDLPSGKSIYPLGKPTEARLRIAEYRRDGATSVRHWLSLPTASG